MNKPVIGIYQSVRDGLWRWRLWAGNGRIMADSGEGYASRSNAVRAAVRASNLMEIAEIV